MIFMFLSSSTSVLLLRHLSSWWYCSVSLLILKCIKFIYIFLSLTFLKCLIFLTVLYEENELSTYDLNLNIASKS